MILMAMSSCIVVYWPGLILMPLWIVCFLRKPSNGLTDLVERTTSVIDGYHAGAYVLEEDADYSKIPSWILSGAPSSNIPAANTIAAGAPPST